MSLNFEVSYSGQTCSWTKDHLTAQLAELARWANPNSFAWSFAQGLHRDRGTATQVALNQLNAKVLETDDKDLIALFRRAHENASRLLPTRKPTPVEIFNRHFQEPTFRTVNTDLTVEIEYDKALVTTRHKIQQRGADPVLVLQAEKHRVHSIKVNGQLLQAKQYTVTDSEIQVLVPAAGDEFELEILSEIDPYSNDSGEGLYVSNGVLTTQCESEGARRIFPCQDQPAIMSKYTVTLIADKDTYPVQLANGNCLGEKELPDGRSAVTFEDPFPKPSYLLAMVMGKFGKIEDTFVTKSGREVKLQIYTEPGKEERARFAMEATKKIMRFDEEKFGLEYDLDTYVQVAMPDFNAGAMENKGLVIFNETALLVDPKCGTDADYRRVAHVVAHEYCHNWSGNRTTVKNWFELALKEAFTEMRSVLFMEWLFGSAKIRPDSVHALRDGQFPDDAAPSAHPIMVPSYYTSDEIYDHTTYTKGSEVFRMLWTILNAAGGPDGFKKGQGEYFKRHDGQAVTFRELLTALKEVSGIDLTQFERWFHQAGTPKVSAKKEYHPDTQALVLTFKQTCPNPKTGEEQDPFDIPVNVGVLSADGSVLKPTQLHHVNTQAYSIAFGGVPEDAVPVFLHDFSAPIRFDYEYTDQELITILTHEKDAFAQVDAGETYCKRALQQTFANGKLPDSTIATFKAVLESPHLGLNQKTRFLELPSMRSILENADALDYIGANQARELLANTIATELEASLLALLEAHPAPQAYDPYSASFIADCEVRALRNRCLSFLARTGKPEHLDRIYAQFKEASNMNDRYAALVVLANSKDPRREEVLHEFYEEWKHDSAIFNKWIRVQTGASNCTESTLQDVQSVDGYLCKNPNHIRSVFRVFVNNLAVFHDPEGKGYKIAADAIMEVGKINEMVAANYIMREAFVDFRRLPEKQQELMRVQIERLRHSSAKAVRAAAAQILGDDSGAASSSGD